MLLILLIWLYLGVTFLNLGFGFHKFIRIKPIDSTLIIVFGMFVTTLLASSWAIFGRINYEFQIFLLALQLIVIIRYKNELAHYYNSCFQEITTLPKKLRYFLIILLFITVFQSSTSPFLIDNETYYIQTIQWLNEYGFMNGLANLHIFLGQTSGWHILQSAFSFSYLTKSNNDLNGFCLLLMNVFSVLELNQYFKTKNKMSLWFGLLPIANLFLIPFCSAPSPDLAVYLFSILLFFYWIKCYSKPTIDSFNVLFLLTIFIIYIKITALPLVCFLVFYFILNYKKINVKIPVSLIFGVIILSLFIIKNTILTGYPFYPSSLCKDYFHTKTELPKAVYDFWWNPAKCYDFIVSKKEYTNLNGFQLFLKWVFPTSITHVFSLFVVLLLLLIPFVLKKKYPKKPIWILYGVMIIQLFFLVLTSPQNRFVVAFVLFFSLLIVSLFLQKETTIYSVIYCSLILVFLSVAYPIRLGKNHQRIDFKPSSFSLTQLAYPKPNSNLKTTFSTQSIGNLNYFSPDSQTYIWATGNGKLPCINTKQIEYIKNKLGYIPQLKGKTLHDGFYSKKVTTP